MYRYLALTAGVLISTLSSAQDHGFADDFSVDSTRFSSGSFDNASDQWSITSALDGLLLEAGSTDSSQPGSVFIQSTKASDSIGIDVSFNAASSHLGNATVFLENRLYSDTPDPDDEDGDIEMQMTYGRNEQGDYSVFYCLLRQLNGSEEPVGEFGGEFCDRLTTGTGDDGVRRSMDIAMNRDSGTITVSFDDVSRTLTLPGNLFPAVNQRQRIQLYLNEGSTGTALATLHTIRANDDVLDGASNSLILDRYEQLQDISGSQRTVSHTPGTLTLTATATEENDYRNRLFLQEPTNYLESTFTISDQSDFRSSGELRGQMELSLYNDQADGGVDGEIGDVNTIIQVHLGANGRAAIEYCLFRRDSAEGDESGLLPDGRRCDILPIRPQIGEPIRLSIALDREAGTVSYRANEFLNIVTVDGSLFMHSRPFAVIAASPRKLSTVVLDIDEIRSSPTTLTTEELNAGATVPNAFPEAVTEDVIEDSTLSFPYEPTTPLDFVDDFSTPTQQLVFDPNNDDSDYGIGLFNGALVLEAASISSDDCCADARLRIQEETDLVLARVSLSSETRIPVDSDAHSLIRISGIWYNDTQDGGFDDRGGDVYVQLRIRLRGDGRREASYCFNRNNGDGSSDGLNIVDGENCGDFESVPELDTEYNLSVELNRDASTMTLGFANETRVIDLGGPVYLAQNSQRNIEVQLSDAASGRAVGRLHSLTTESGTVDFTTGAPLIAPYRPEYASQSPGRSVDVVNGRLRLEVDSSIGGDSNQPRFVSRSPSDFVGAELEISSESRTDGDFIRLGVGGQMYNDIMDGGRGADNSEGAVFAAVNLVMNDEGEDYAEYCAFRSNVADFSDSIELINGPAENCLRFNTQPVLDTPAQASVSIDTIRGVLVFTIEDEVVEYTITTGIFTPHNYFNGVFADARGGSKLVGFVDNLAFSDDPVPLAESETSLTFVSDDEPAVNTPASSGGGCSISGSSGGLAAPMLTLLGLLGLHGYVRRRRTSQTST